MNQRLVIIIAIISFALGFLCNYEIMHNKKAAQSKTEVQYTLKEESVKNTAIADVESNGKAEVLPDFEKLSKQFYTNLENCEPLNVVSSNGYEAYIIEGIVDDKCNFKHRQVGFVDTICNLPMDIAKKYASEGLEEIRQLEDLKAQNKTGFVQSSQFIVDINNDKTYCRYRQYEHKK